MSDASTHGKMRRLTLLLVVVAACADAGNGTDGDGEATAPLIGVDGSHDQADRNCHVVLRQLARSGSGFFYETNGSSWVWGGTVEISAAAAAEGLVPSAMYHLAPNGPWTSVDATPSQATATPGFVRFDVRLDQNLPGPGWSGTSLSNAKIEVVPFVRLPQGGRLFDHNRNPGDLTNYVMTIPELAIGTSSTACPPPAGPNRARLVFDATYHQHVEGQLIPGGDMSIVYDGARLSQCRDWRNGAALYDITAHMLFSPGNERRDVSVRDGAATLVVPSGARRVALWFENTSATGCQAWDSNFGNNYVFDALAAPQWIGDVQTLIVRDSGDPCIGGIPAAQGFGFDTWARQRAVVSNLCFAVYQPGLTDRDDPNLWQKLDVTVHWRYVGQPTWQSTYVGFDRRVGNNARYKINLRELDPFRMYHCPEIAPTPTADGQYTQLAFQYYLVVNGAEVRPAPNATFGGTFTDYVSDFWRTSNCH